MAFGISDLVDAVLTMREVEQLIPHEKFEYGAFIRSYANNVGLIKLKGNIAFNARVRPIELPKNDNLDLTVQTVQIIGWGQVCILPIGTNF